MPKQLTIKEYQNLYGIAEKNSILISIAKDGTGDYNCSGTDWDGNDQEIINKAISEAPVGSIILFKPATYYLKGKGGNKTIYGYWGSIHIEKRLHFIAYGAIFNAKQGVDENEYEVPEKDEYAIVFQSSSDNSISGSSWRGGEVNFTDDSSPSGGGGGLWINSNLLSTQYETKDIIVEDLIVRNTADNTFGTYGIYIEQSVNIKINNCSFYHSKSSAVTWDGSDTDDGTDYNLFLNNCYFNSCARGIRNNQDTYFLRGFTISNCQFDDCEYGIVLGASYNGTVNNCDLKNITESALQLNGSGKDLNINLSNINIDTTGSDAVGISGNYVQLENIFIKNTGTYGIHVNNGVSGNLVFNNVVIENTSPSGDGRGIYFYWGSGDLAENVIISNFKYKGVHNGIMIKGRRNVNISNCVIEDTAASSTNYGLYIYNSCEDIFASNIEVRGYSNGKRTTFSNTGVKKVVNCTDYSRDLDDCPIVDTGTTSPSSTPSKSGDIFVDTTAGNVYIAKGTSSSADWIQVN